MKKSSRRPRRFKRYAEKGVPEPPCLFCIEEEHASGRNHDASLIGPACQKHHRELTRRRTAAGISMSRQAHPVRQVVEGLRSEAVFLELLAESKYRKALALENFLENNK